MSYLFIKICFKEKSCNIVIKIKNLKKPKKLFLVVFFGWVVLGGFFWVGCFGWVFYCQPCLVMLHEKAHVEHVLHRVAKTLGI
jgi:hypothetical protein